MQVEVVSKPHLLMVVFRKLAGEQLAHCVAGGTPQGGALLRQVKVERGKQLKRNAGGCNFLQTREFAKVKEREFVVCRRGVLKSATMSVVCCDALKAYIDGY